MLGLVYKTRARLQTRASGLTIMELPAAMGIMFLGFFFPLLCLILMVVRFTLFLEAARESADAACQAQTFSGTSSTNGNMHTTSVSTDIGAVSLAQNSAINVASMITGVTINPDDVKCFIITTPLNNTTAPPIVSGPNQPLSGPVDDSANLYQLRVDVLGQIQPIFCLPSGIFGDIPGLTGPFPVTTSMVRVFANPQGLYQSSPGGTGGDPGGPGGPGGDSVGVPPP